MASGLYLPKSMQQHVVERNAQIAEARTAGEIPTPQKIEDNAEFQARSRMSRDEKFIGAIETLARARKIFHQQMFGKEVSIEQCRKEMEHIVRKFARDKGIE